MTDVRRAVCAGVLAAIGFTGCVTESSTASIGVKDFSSVEKIATAESKGDVFLNVFVDEEAKSNGPVDMQISVDGQPVIERSFMLGKNDTDGKFQFQLPEGTHTLEAVSRLANDAVKKKFKVKGNKRQFVELYVTEKGRVRLTPQSKVNLLLLVIAKSRKPPTATFNPNLWMRVPVHPRMGPGTGPRVR